MLDAFQVLSPVPELRRHIIGITGAGAADPSKNTGTGNGITVTWVSTGRYKFVWGDLPGVFVGMVTGLMAATPAQLADYTLVATAFSASSKQIEVFVYNAAGSLADLTSTQQAFIDFMFKATSV